MLAGIREFAASAHGCAAPSLATLTSGHSACFAACWRTRRPSPWQCSAEAAEAQVLADPLQIQQVLLNLLKNACDAQQAAGREQMPIVVSLQRDGARLALAVRDHGNGLDLEAQGRLFEPFSPPSPMALAWVCRFAKPLPKRTAASSADIPADGPGLCLWLRLPCLENPLHEHRPHVHVIDDEAPFCARCCFCWNPPAGQPAAMTAPRRFWPPTHLSAWRWLSGRRYPHAACQRPGITTPFASRRIAVSADFVTGHGDVELAVEAMKAGAVDFLQNPFATSPFWTPSNARWNSAAPTTQPASAARKPAPSSPACHRAKPRWRAGWLGWANKAIARQLAISEHTVHVHRQHIMDKTDAGSPADLAWLILRRPGRAG